METGGLLDVLTDFAHALARGHESTEVLQDLAGRVRDVLGITGAGVSLLHGDRMAFVTSCTDSAELLEHNQELHQSGPCVDAVGTGEVISIADLNQSADRWPEYADLAASLSISAVASIPMRLDEMRIGALDLYDAPPHAWSEEELGLAHVLADMATSYVVNLSKLEQQRRTSEQLQRALDRRIIIEQAKGIISSDRGTSIDEAFEVLRKHANDHQAGLHTTAYAVVKLGLRPG